MLNFLLVLANIFITNSLTPLSECIQGRITGYDEYQDGGSCGFGPPKIYGAAPNEAFYNNGEKCGICYELIGPDGVLYFMVDSYCPVLGNEKACSGDMLHFDLHRNGFSTIEKQDLGIVNVTFRMVACNHKGNIIVKTKKEVSQYYYEFVVMNHVIGLKKVYYSYDKKNWIGLERQGDYNHWRIGKIDNTPFYFQFESISGEKIMTKIDEIKAAYSHDTGVQFKVPKDMYFNVDKLTQISNTKKEECCKLNDAFTNIYNEGKYFGEWQYDTNCKINIENNSGCKEDSNKCIRVEFANWSYFQIRNRILIESKRYQAIEFYIKSEKECKNCLKIQLEKQQYLLSTKKANVWEKIVVKFSDFGFKGDKVKVFLFQGTITDNQIFYFDDIKLVKSDYIDNGICYSYSKSPSSSTTAVLVVFFLIIVIAAVSIGAFWYIRYKRNNYKINFEGIMSKIKLLQ